MILTFTAALCLLGAAALWRWAFSDAFAVDAAPAGSMILVVSVVLGIVSVFLFGVQVGTML